MPGSAASRTLRVCGGDALVPTAAGLSMLFVGLSACGLADRPFLRTRKELLRGALASGAAAFASRSADAAALPWERDVAANPLQARFLEKLRILLQDEADATQYGGELAPGGPPVGLPYLSLVPIVQMQSVLVRSRDAVADRKQWPALITLFSTGQFETIEFKRIFNQFSDNIYYASDTTEANVYLLGGATPSSSQTQQYLLRNEALKQVSELVDELRFLSTASEEQLQKLPPEEAQGAAAAEYLDKAIKVFADHLALLTLTLALTLAASSSSCCAASSRRASSAPCACRSARCARRAAPQGHLPWRGSMRTSATRTTSPRARPPSAHRGGSYSCCYSLRGPARGEVSPETPVNLNVCGMCVSQRPKEVCGGGRPSGASSCVRHCR